MAVDPKEIAKEAYIAYVTEKGFPPKNASHLINFGKFHIPPFVGMKYSITRDVVCNPPNIDNTQPITQSNIINAKPTSSSNPYLDASLTQQFISPIYNKAFTAKHDKAPKKSKIANAFDLYKEKMNKTPMNAIDFLGFCEKNNLNCTYSECIQYIQHLKKSKPFEKKSRVRALSDTLLQQNIKINPQKPASKPFKPFKSGDKNATKIKTVFQALSDLEDINNEEKYELIKQSNAAKVVQVEDTEKIRNELNEYLERMKIKNKIDVSCPEEILSSHSYHDDRYNMKITPITPDPVLSVDLDIKYNEWDINIQNQFIIDLAMELNVNPSQLIPICISSGSVKCHIQICNIINDKFPFIEKKFVSFKKNTNKICQKWKLKACQLQNWAANKLRHRTHSKQIKMDDDYDDDDYDDDDDDDDHDDEDDDDDDYDDYDDDDDDDDDKEEESILNTAEKWLLNQAETLRAQIVASLQDCPEQYEISGICILDNDKCLNEFIKLDGWKDSKLLFHGTKLAHLASIYENGFDDKFIGSATDPGWFGRGHYFSSYPQYCMTYCEPNQFEQRTLFVSYVNLGNTFQVYDTETYYGEPLEPGYQSHYVKVKTDGQPIPQSEINDYSEDIYDEYVVETGKRVLPRFCVTFTKKKSVVVWRDPKLNNEENSFIMDKLSKSNVIYGALNTDDALKIIKKKKDDNSVYVITNGGDNSDGFINSIRNELNVEYPILVFTASITKYNELMDKYKDITITVSESDVYEFVKKYIENNEYKAIQNAQSNTNTDNESGDDPLWQAFDLKQTLIWNETETKWNEICKASTMKIYQDDDKIMVMIKDSTSNQEKLNHIMPIKISEKKISCQWIVQNDLIQKENDPFTVFIKFKSTEIFVRFMKLFHTYYASKVIYFS